MADQFKLQFPFSVQSQHRIADFAGPAPIPLPGLSASLVTAPDGYAIAVDGFPSSSSAHSFVAQAWLGLTTLMLDTKTPFSASTRVHEGQPIFVTNPQLGPNLQGARHAVNEGEPYVVPSDAALIKFGAGTATFSTTTPIQRVIAALARGMAHPKAEALFADSRFRTAVDLFSAASFEETGTARLLTYSMALEVLPLPMQKHPVALALLEKWGGEVRAEIANLDAASTEVISLESLEQEIIFRKDVSISSRIRHFVRARLTAAGATDAEEMSKMALKAYGSRSRLLHNGSLPQEEIGNAITNFRLVLERLFEATLAESR